MALRIVGAGLGRTGTNSLKVALEQLLDGPCYHMFELIAHQEKLPDWERAVRGEEIDWEAMLDGYVATVDWPGCAFWRELRAANPDALVLLSVRESPEAWWASMESTIIPILSGPPVPGDPDGGRGQAMIKEMFRSRLTPDWADRDSAIAAYERHCEEVRREVPAGSLVEWRTGDGWEAICSALGLPAPFDAFPHENASGDFAGNVERHMARDPDAAQA
jgi:hypothetical protein